MVSGAFPQQRYFKCPAQHIADRACCLYCCHCHWNGRLYFHHELKEKKPDYHHWHHKYSHAECRDRNRDFPNDFIITHFTKGAGIDTLSTKIYTEVKKGIKPEMYALSTLIFVTVLILLILVNKAPGKEKGGVSK